MLKACVVLPNVLLAPHLAPCVVARGIGHIRVDGVELCCGS
jgi:hypothetical protein